ncbi:MAG: hypothetical protein HYY61_03085 [Deltaproteobacteria bacterium]|nr:hypothetical protein [Deltaproteobacteria bacterium]
MPLALSNTNKNEVQEIRKVKIEFVADEKVAKLIERAKELLRHKYPHGKLADLVREAFELLLEKKDPERKIARLEKKEIIQTQSSQNDAASQNGVQHKTRYIPKILQREIFKRDEGRGEKTFGKRSLPRNPLSQIPTS